LAMNSWSNHLLIAPPAGDQVSKIWIFETILYLNSSNLG
jgi:hypothetical protein